MRNAINYFKNISVFMKIAHKSNSQMKFEQEIRYNIYYRKANNFIVKLYFIINLDLNISNSGFANAFFKNFFLIKNFV